MLLSTRLRILGILTLLIGLASASVTALFLKKAYQSSHITGSGGSHNTLGEVVNREYIRCGINGGLGNFSSGFPTKNNKPTVDFKSDTVDGESLRVDEERGFYTDASGFEPDFCRAVAIAVFGEYENRVLFKNLLTTDRFTALDDKTIDVLIRNTTWTSERDIELSLDFAPVIFHDGQKLIARKSSKISSIEDLQGKRICVPHKTTSKDNIEKFLSDRNVEHELITIDSEGNPIKSTQSLKNEYAKGSCDAATSDTSTLISLQEIPPSHDHAIFPDEPISYEPLAPVVRSNDSQWRDVVSYAVWITMWGVENKTDEISTSSSSKIFSTTWKSLGLPETNLLNILNILGNYDDIYDRHLGDILPTKGANNVITQPHKVPRMFSPPLK